MEEMNANNIDLTYLNEYNNVNISVKNKQFNKNYKISCFMCQQDDNMSVFESCFTSCNSNTNLVDNTLPIVSDESSIIIKNNRKRRKYKIQVSELFNDKLNLNSSIFININNLNNHENCK